MPIEVDSDSEVVYFCIIYAFTDPRWPCPLVLRRYSCVEGVDEGCDAGVEEGEV
jgi:hypothetical protein